jgi:hypothetical protein
MDEKIEKFLQINEQAKELLKEEEKKLKEKEIELNSVQGLLKLTSE